MDPGPNHGSDTGEDEHLDEWVTQDDKNMSVGPLGLLSYTAVLGIPPKPSWGAITVLEMAGGSAKCQKQTLTLLNLSLIRGTGSP